MGGAETRLKAATSMAVIMPIKDEIGAVLLDDPLEFLVVVEGAPPRRQARHRRVMDEDHAVEAALAQIMKKRGQAGQLTLSQLTAGPT